MSILYTPIVFRCGCKRVLFSISTFRKLSVTFVWRPQSRYTMSHQIPGESEMSRQNRATPPPPPNQGIAPFSGPPCRTFLSFAAGRGPRGGGSRRASGGYRGTFGFRKRIMLQGGVAATVTPIALLCATKFGNTIAWECFKFWHVEAMTTWTCSIFQYC